MICSIVVLYEPKQDDFFHICDYYDEVDIAFVMDNSKDSNESNVKEIIKRKFGNCKKIRYYHYPENIGLCKALNIAMKFAKNIGCGWALLMDADSSFITNIVKIYKNKLQNASKEVAIFSPVHIHERSSKHSYNGEKKLKWAMTSGCLYNIDIFEELGGFKEELFVDGLDIDYCYRAGNNGYDIVECGDALLKHYPAETRELKIGSTVLLRYGMSSPERYKMQARSLIWLICKYKQSSDVIRYIWKTTKVILFFDNKIVYIRQLIQGTKEGFALCRVNDSLLKKKND